MASIPLFLLVEGSDDDRFCRQVVEPLLRDRYTYIRIVQYAAWNLRKMRSFLHSMSRMQADWILLGDNDNATCVTQRKGILVNSYSALDLARVVIVIEEIESWYLAGLDDAKCQGLGLNNIRRIDRITKEMFHQRMPDSFDSTINFMIEMLKWFSTDVARRKNRSFNYFYEKHL